MSGGRLCGGETGEGFEVIFWKYVRKACGESARLFYMGRIFCRNSLLHPPAIYGRMKTYI